MRGLLISTCLSLSISLLVANVALAQTAPSGEVGGQEDQGALMLVNIGKIQMELKMTDDQIGIVRKLEDEWVAGLGAVFTSPREERKARLAESARKVAELNQKVKALLTAEQSARLRQIEIWMGGVAILLTDEAAAKDLKLTDPQKDQIKTIVDDHRTKSTELVKSLRGIRGDQRTRIQQQNQALREEAATACRSVLSEEQQARFDEMRGLKFELTAEDMRRAQLESRDRRLGKD